jgi:hypothetical protein
MQLLPYSPGIVEVIVRPGTSVAVVWCAAMAAVLRCGLKHFLLLFFWVLEVGNV